ncbi:type III restriction-modification system EcoP15I subunit M [Xenorhabdus sp. PB62.4]|nr:DNA methyltransferase [Xenorhabdus sp. PB62.4]MBC8953079.1 type III restriction-modification system EcoP15I subunit M [Xenorhabdus sp. PB62.4]
MTIEKITLNYPESKSADITQENIDQLKQLFPEVFFEGKIDFYALKAVLGEEIDDSDERYNFTWHGKAQSRLIAQTPSTGTLRPCKEESVNWDTTENLFIEGDNLEVLKILQKSYHKKVKMIYIDPPYNTGIDFVYKDNYHDNMRNYLEVTGQININGQLNSTNRETSGRYHSSWLNMIFPRLLVAKNLLHPEGMIYISIDDNEVFNLVKVCEEIFGYDAVKIIAVKMSEASGLKMASVKKLGIIPKLKEYIIAIKPSGINNIKFTPIKKPKWDSEYNIYLDNFSRENRDFYDSIKDSEYLSDDQLKKLDEILSSITLKPLSEVYKGPVSKKNEWLFDNSWRICQCVKSSSVYKLSEEKKKNKKISGVFSVKSAQGLVYLVRGTYPETSRDPRLQLIFASDNLFVHPGDFWAHIKTTGLDNEGGVPYKNGKKPLKLVTELISSLKCLNDGDIVLDFFAGSATTGEATMIASKNNNVKLNYILVQLPENLEDTYKLANADMKKQIKESMDYLNELGKPLSLTELGKQRIRMSIEKYKTESQVDGFKIFKLDETNIRSWDVNFDNLEPALKLALKSIKDDRSVEDILYEILLKYGIELTTRVEEATVEGKKIFIVGTGALIVCLDDGITEQVVEGIAKLKEKLNPENTQVVFKDQGFADSVVKTNAIQILKQYGIDDVKSI